MNVLKCIDPSRWWCFDYTTCFQGVIEACFQLNKSPEPYNHMNTCLLASCHCPTQTHTDTLYSICTVVSFIPTLGLIQWFVRCRTWAQSQQHPEIIPNIRRSCFLSACKMRRPLFPPIQSVSVNNATPKLLLLLLWWNVDSSGLQSRLFSRFMGNNDIITLCAKFGKFYCVWMSQVVQNKSSRWIENWRIWDKSVRDVSFPDCAQTSVVSNIRLWNTIVSIKTMRC